MKRGQLVAFLTGLVLAWTVGAQELIVYPAKGQDQAQQKKDDYECYQWATAQTGFDPMQAPTATAPPPEDKDVTASAGKGALGGAATGAAVGALTGGSWSQGAAIGAVAGGLFGNHRKNKQKNANRQADDQWANEQAASYQQRRNNYNRAKKTCLEGRGYTVS